MEVKNIYVTDYLFFINGLLKTLSFNNISYVIIKNDDHTELHFNDYIFRIYSGEKQIGLDMIYNAIYHNGESNNSSKLFTFSDAEKNLLDLKISNEKERPGFKKYTKRNIRNDKRHYSVLSRSVGAKSPRR